MSKNKNPQIGKNNGVSIIRSSAAEYLTFVASSGKGGVEAIYADENIWLTQKMMGGAVRRRNPHHQLPSKEGVCRQ